MKKILTKSISVILIAANLTACANRSPENLSGTQSESRITNETPSSAVQSAESEHDPNPEPESQKPAGEPTFLTAPDGVPIYTSEITEIFTGIYTGVEEWDDNEPITLEQAEQLAREGGGFNVKCEGFAYGYIPAKAFNREEEPELFSENSRGSFDYLGEMSDEKSGYNKYSVDLTRFKAGDKLGDLTVKNAYTLFKNNKWEADLSEIFGAHVFDGYIEFDGELELAGYINVTPMETLYGTGGDMTFIPNGEGSTKLPCLDPIWDPESGGYSSIATIDFNGYLGDWKLDLGNMYEVGCDTSGLQPGDNFVKVKVVLDNIKFVPGNFGGLKVELKNIEVL